MSIFKKVFNEEYDFYSTELQLNQENKKLFELYIYSVYEKIKLICEIKNKYFDIKHKKIGFIDEDIASFKIQRSLFDGTPITDTEKNQNFFYKRWTNKRLKRILKILNLEIKYDNKIIQNEMNICNLLDKMILETSKKEELEICIMLKQKFQLLNENVSQQLKELNNIYPIKDWTIDLHEKIISENFLNLINQECKLIFGIDSKLSNYNLLPSLISKVIHENEIEVSSYLSYLIRNNIKKIKENKEKPPLSFRKCFHARPMSITTPLFPLDTSTKSAGFYVDMDIDETKNIACRLWNVNYHDLEIFELQIPENLFKDTIRDFNNDSTLRNISIKNSFVFKPSLYPKINEFFIKNLLKIKKVSSN